MKRLLISISIIFSLVLLPSTADAAICGEAWEVAQLATSYIFVESVDACVAAGSNQGCLDTALFNYETQSDVNTFAWAACCIALGLHNC